MKPILSIALMLLATASFAESYVIQNVTVLPMTEKEALSNRHVVIEDGLITAITKKAKSIPKDAVPIDGTGKFLIPGLWDMHAHISGNADTALPMFLANGVTSIRDMGGDPDDNLAVRDAVASGERLGPRILSPGPILESPAFVKRMQSRDIAEDPLQTRIGVGSEADAKAAIARLKSLGADFVKIRTYDTKETHLAISKAADEAGLQLFGHAELPYRFLLASNQMSYEHLPTDRMKRMDEEERRAVWKQMAQRGIAIVPTTVNYTHSIFIPIEKIDQMVDGFEVEQDPRRKYLSKSRLSSWREQIVDRKESVHPDYQAMFDVSFRNFREAHKEGVAILPGTDNGVLLMYSGFSLHDELEMLVKHLEVPPIDILRNATLGSARLMKLDESLGTIEVGKQADLILLNADPLEDITHTQMIESVFTRGKHYTRQALDELLAEVAGLNEMIVNSN